MSLPSAPPLTDQDGQPAPTQMKGRLIIAGVLLVVAVLILTTGCVASSGGTVAQTVPSSAAPVVKSSPSPEHDPGCVWVAEAQATYEDTVNGVSDQTLTAADAADGMGDVQQKLTDASGVAEDATVAARTRTGAVHAGRLRVTFLGQGDADVKSEVDALFGDLNAAAAAC